jgi:hypothetical protein
MVMADARPARGVRLTRRGRLVVILFLLALAAVALALVAPASDAATPAGANTTVVVVRPGDSLWSIAARYLPSRDAPGAIEEVRRLNGLDGYTIHAGERLTLPKRH